MGELRARGLQHFDSWAATFGEPVTALELSPDGAGYRLHTRFCRFINVPELMQMFRETADVQTAQMLQLPVPVLENDKAVVISASATPHLKVFVSQLAARAEKLKTGRVDPREDNMLKITSEGRKAALDLRLVDPRSQDHAESKVNLAVRRIHEIWERTAANRSTQLVFCDLSTPKDRGFSVYNDMADKLAALGVPRHELAFVQSYESDADKLALFKDVRAGKVRILVGSTQKMGSGTNVQERLIALHHLDAPWRPADVEQREGRILRQGNNNAVVQIYRYVAEQSFDSYSWQVLETKARFIHQVMSGDATVRRIEDIDSAALTYAEVKAIASGNPLVIEKAQVDAELLRFTRLRASHFDAQFRIRSNIRHLRDEAETLTRRIADLREDLPRRQSTAGEDFRILIDGQMLDNRGVAGELLLRRAEKLKGGGDDHRVGEFAGFDLYIRTGIFEGAEMLLRGKGVYSVKFTDTALGTARALEHVVQTLDQRLGDCERLLAEARQQSEKLAAKIGQPFEHDDRLAELARRQDEIVKQLDLTRNQASSQMDSSETQTETQQTSDATNSLRRATMRRATIRV